MSGGWRLRCRIGPVRDAPLDEWSGGEHPVQVWRADDGEPIAYGFRRDRRYWMHWPSCVTYEIAVNDPVAIGYPSSRTSASAVQELFHRSVVPFALHDRGFEALHASSVLTAKGVVAFAGRSTAGKSTLACALSRRGYRQWSDDAVVWQADKGRPKVVPLPFSIRLRPQSPTLTGPSRINTATPLVPTRLSAIYFLRRDAGPEDRRLGVRPLRNGEAIQQLLTHAYECDPADSERRGRMLEHYLDVMATTPLYELTFRHDREAFPRFVEDVVQVIDAHA